MEHHHVVCTRCKTNLALNKDEVEPVRMKRNLPKGYKVLRTSAEFHGLCPACAMDVG
jgi:Fe2+ or Zn2+ uptake regulation protein